MRGRTRKFQALLLAIAVMANVLALAVPALASGAAGANLTAGREVLPGTAQYTVRVTGVAGAINAVRILLPSDAGVKNNTDLIVPPAGWTAARTTAGPQAVIFKGGPLLSGQQVAFSFPAAVDRPFNGDKAGAFQVQVSSDGGATSTAAQLEPGGTLTTTVKALETTLVAPSAPAGVLDRTGTAGQSITYDVAIKNHALSALTVTPSLTSNNSSDTITAAAGGSIAAGGTSTFSFPLKLGTATADRATSFTGGGTSEKASAVRKVDSFTVQVAPTIVLTNASFSPKTVRSNPAVSYTFTVEGEKRGTPGIDLTSGTLKFADTTANLQLPVSYGAAGEKKVLSFGPTSVTGADGKHTARFTFTWTDANGHTPDPLNVSITDAITIDSIAPKVILDKLALPLDGDLDQQSAAKNGDTVGVSGTIDDTAANIDFVKILSNAGDDITVPVTRDAVDRTKFSGSAKVTFAPTATEFWAIAQATDTAGNSGGDDSDRAVIDNVAPALNSGQTNSTTEIQVLFADNTLVKGACQPGQWLVDGKPIVARVRYFDGTACEPRKAGADNFRLLTLTAPIDRDAEPAVTYSPVAGDRAKDGAGNFALQKTVDAISGIAPPAPDIRTVTRSNKTETATLDEGKYWTRFGGDDLNVNFAGGRDGYFVQVLDANDNVLKTEGIAGSPADVRVPIGSTEGEYVRKIRLVNTRGLAGPSVTFTVVLDQTLPAIASSTKGATVPISGEDIVDVAFSEKLWSGSNFAFHWYTFENVTMDDGSTGQKYYVVNRVSGSGTARRLESPMEEKGPFGGVDYIYDGSGTRYVDRAGNAMADTTGSIG